MVYNLISFAGIFVLIGLGWLFSSRRRAMNWRAIGFGVALQWVIGLMVFRIRAGTQIFLWINDGAVKVLETAAEGAKFVFGPLAIPAGQDKSLGFILAFQAFPTIIFFSALIAILYYYGIMSALIRAFAYVFTRLMRISGAESLVTASNIFVGVEANLFEAVINGANSGARMIVGITALLIAVLGLVALADLLLGSVGAKINPLVGLSGTWSLKALCGYAFYPLTVILGIPLQDASVASRIIGERLIVTEVTAYSDLATVLAQGQFHVPDRSAVITTYALCGFAHLASMAIFVGGVCALAPGRTRDLARVAPRALAAATLACLMTACVAGTFYTEGSVLFGR
jgi:nucleoside permease NupC